MAIKNHTQIEELRLSERLLWEKRVGRKRGNPSGVETPLGHAYSMILEELANERLDSTPKPEEFLEHVKSSLKHRGWSLESKHTTLETPSYSSSNTFPIYTYMKMKALSQEAQSRVMKEIIGGYEPY